MVALVVPPSVDPLGPEAIATVTETPTWLTGFPFASRSWMTGCCANDTPLCAVLEGSVLILSRAAAPAVPVAVKVTGLPLIPDPAALAVSVLLPAVEPRIQEVAAATPFAPVTTGAVGSTEPPPVATAKVTLTPATGLPLASRAITDGGVATAVPAVAVWLLPPFTPSDATAPALKLMVPEVAVASPEASKRRV